MTVIIPDTGQVAVILLENYNIEFGIYATKHGKDSPGGNGVVIYQGPGNKSGLNKKVTLKTCAKY
ncbi:MAG: hypothetical protein U1D67_03145 [Dehalococcoidia bacterium]|nr:hypothetical protein [Dehalococcoidia bacterium]